MALEDLDDLARLEIPYIGFVIFAASYDPLTARDAEARRNAVLHVCVPCVRFQAACGLVVPQTNRAVVCRRQDVLRVGGELDVLADG